MKEDKERFWVYLSIFWGYFKMLFHVILINQVTTFQW